jgi:DNA ligase D
VTTRYVGSVASPFVEIEVDDRVVKVTNPDRVYFPESGATKLDLVEYYLAVGPGIVNALFERPTMLHRFPTGLSGDKVHQKRLPAGAPPWVDTVRLHFPRWNRTADELCVTELGAVIWAVQMSTVEFHPWNSRRDDPEKPDEWRIDLDPGPLSDYAQVRRVAHVVHEVLDELGVVGYPKTTGSKGLHLYVSLEPRWSPIEVRQAAVAVARELARRRPDLITDAWWKEERGRRVFVDFNQNAPHKTVFGAWSARSRVEAQVSTPLTRDELATVMPDTLTVRTVPARVAEQGDPWAERWSARQSLEPFLEMWAADRAAGLMDAPWPPVYPKMPDEPPRVAPSRARAEPGSTPGQASQPSQ